MSLAVAAVLLSAMMGAGAAPPATDQRLVGVQLHSLWDGGRRDAVERDLALADRLGATIVRVDVGWSTLQPHGPGRWSAPYLARLDRLVAGAHARGIKVIATLWSTPCWASAAPDRLRRGCRGAWWRRGVERHPPRSAERFAAPARLLAGRYGTRLAAIELWNEPNERYFWRTGAPVRRYVALARAGLRGARAGNPRVPVLVGSLAWSDARFLRRLYRAGLGDDHDGLAFHPYSENRPPGEAATPATEPYRFLTGIRLMRAAQAAAGDTAPLWLTEFGWTSCRAHRYCVSRAAQATYLTDALRLLDDLPFVRAATVYKLRAYGRDRADRADNYALVDADFTPKPAYSAVRALLRAGARAAAG